MDITTEGFGYMLAFGDIAWVPFTYSLQTRYLVDYPQPLSWAYVLFVLVVHFIGFYIFRGANAQKDTFRRNPSDPSVKRSFILFIYLLFIIFIYLFILFLCLVFILLL